MGVSDLTQAIVILFFFATGVLGLGSLAWWIRAISRARNGIVVVPKRFRQADVEVNFVAVLLVFAWLIVHFISSFSASDQQAFDPESVYKVAKFSVQEGLLVAFVLGAVLISSDPHPITLVKLGFRIDRLGEQLRNGCTGFVAAFAPVFVVLVLTFPLRTEESVHPLLRLLMDRGLGEEFLWIMGVAVFVAPLKEELLFRVVLQSWLERVCGVRWGILLTAVAFAAVHGYPDSLAIFPLALVLGILYHIRRSFVAVCLTHALFNAYNLWAAITSTLSEETWPPL